MKIKIKFEMLSNFIGIPYYLVMFSERHAYIVELQGRVIAGATVHNRSNLRKMHRLGHLSCPST